MSTTAATCPACGVELEITDAVESACPVCGTVLTTHGRPEVDAPGYATRSRDGLDNAARIAAGGGATTFFQPGLLASGADREVEDSPADEAAPLPPLKLDFEAFFMVLGAAPGEERIRLERARTIFGRKRADVDLADAKVSASHFQIDVMGRELFVRDLESRNGTFLNGHRVRYSELLPGDELRAGDTVLVFRTSNDGLSRS